CLFCHRKDVGPAWATNRHNLTLRKADADALALVALSQAPGLKDDAGKVQFLLGGKHRQRFLKAAASYGKLDLLLAGFAPSDAGKEGRLIDADKPHWDAKTFADGCAGCHASAVDAKTRAFAAVSLDCFTCHGEVPDKHTKEPAAALLAKKRVDSARVVISICASCHVRTGKSKASGLAYPNNFVAGPKLFSDFQVDSSHE